jgi:hypothetical protein
MSNPTPTVFPHVPEPPSERGALALALGVLVVGAGVLAVLLSGAWRGLAPSPVTAPPPVVEVAATPSPGAGVARSPAAGTIVAAPPPATQGSEFVSLVSRSPTRVSERWESGFYPLYAVASRAFGVNWLLLASIHKQETAFSTAPSTYHGLNFAGCCGGPMQFNVSNGPRTTWALVRDSYLYAPRPPVYNHRTAAHPSIYDDFDAMMAAARLLAADGAGPALDGSAWQAAYDYYGHDANGVTYADQVLARAISWSQRGFCVNCGLNSSMVAAVHAAYGAPALAVLIAQTARVRRPASKPHARGAPARPTAARVAVRGRGR